MISIGVFSSWFDPADLEEEEMDSDEWILHLIMTGQVPALE